VIDPAALKHSGFPWNYRKNLGRLRAFLRTVWLVTADSKILRHEAAKPQSPHDAAVFRRWVAAVAALCFAAGVIMLIETGAIVELAGQDQSPFALLSQPRGWMLDVLVPWWAGVTLQPALFGYAVTLAVYSVGATRPIFRTRGLLADYAETVEAISGYVVAPLVWLLPATAGYSLVLWLDATEPHPISRTWVGPVLMIVTGLLAVLAIAGTVYRTGQWRARTAHAGYATGFAAMGELVARWAVGCVVLLGIVPWCVGLVWIAIDSFRR
jgi:hypothetical protein